VFHRCVIAVIGVLTISTSAAAGPFKLEASAPSFEGAELRSMDEKELRALFFSGGGARNAAGSCASCLLADSSRRARDRDAKAQYAAAFPVTSARLAAKSAANRSSKRSTANAPDLLAGPAAVTTDALGAVPLPSSEGSLAAVTPAAVPEPNTLALMGAGVAGFWMLRRRRQGSQHV
jgi:hypothetical protein